MNEVFETLQRFQQQLEIFNDQLKSSFTELQRNNEKLNPYWQDNMRREYDVLWNTLEERMKRYVSTDGDNYSEIVLHKVQLIRRYLYGD